MTTLRCVEFQGKELFVEVVLSPDLISFFNVFFLSFAVIDSENKEKPCLTFGTQFEVLKFRYKWEETRDDETRKMFALID